MSYQPKFLSLLLAGGGLSVFLSQRHTGIDTVSESSSITPDGFIEQATSPWSWYSEAIRLLKDANILRERWSEKFEEIKQLREGEWAPWSTNERRRLSRRTTSLRRSSLLLTGLSLENALKGYLIDIRPEEVDLKATMNGRGELTGVTFNEIGNSNINHSLTALTKEAGLYEVEDNPVVLAPEDLDDFEDKLSLLEQIVRWHGRYPTPLTYSDKKTLREEILPDESTHLEFYTETYEISKKLVVHLTPSGLWEEG